MPDFSPAPGLRQAAPMQRLAWRKPSLLGPLQLKLLGESGVIAKASHWSDEGRSALWLYNAHYLDDLTALGSVERHSWQAELVDRWIADNPPATGIGWAPYPTSLRLVNTIFWLLDNPHAQRPDRVLSLAVQTRFLARRLEHHILGNHLLANAKALVFSGLMFTGAEADAWYNTGMALLRDELGEQVLPDGGHFERSPMYHNIILTDLLDMMSLHAAFDRPAPKGWAQMVQKMFEWAAAMTHPDGGIALFNDAAFDIAPTLAELFTYALTLGLDITIPPTAEITAQFPSGYVRLAQGPATVIADLAPVGPDYLPAHAHADTLSFELSLGKERIVVNGGTSRYGLGPERHRQRATASHSTLALDGMDSSEVWGGFRVARRARIVETASGRTDKSLWVSGTHDGYSRLPGKPLHRRDWVLSASRLEVKDVVTGEGSHSVAIFFHLAPGLAATKESDGSITLRRGEATVAQLLSDGADSLSITPSTWHPRFGQSIANQCLRADLSGALPLRHCITFNWRQA